MLGLRSCASAFVLFVLVLAGPANAQDSPWEVRLLPSDEAWTYHSAFSINEAGIICGNYGLADGTVHAVLWKNGIWVDVGSTYGLPDGFPLSAAQTLNDAGLIGGLVWTAKYGEPDRRSVAILWDTVQGTHEVVHPEQLGFPQSQVVAVNDSGLVTITVYDEATPDGTTRAYLLDRNTGTGTLLPLASGLGSSDVSRINESGIAAGYLQSDFFGTVSHAAVWLPDGTVRDLHDEIRGLLPAATWSRAFGVDENGCVSGTASDEGFAETWAWTWSEGDGVVILDRGSAGGSFAIRKTDRMVIGLTGDFSESQGAVWIDGILHEFPKVPGATTIFGNTANSSGVIIGDARGADFLNIAFVAVPRDVGDFDGDGLEDKWEIQGYTHDNSAYVDLPGMGANPLRKDLFVQIDSMVDGGNDHRPAAATLQPVVDAFAARGIALHLNIDEDIAFDAELGTLDGLGRYQWDEFDALKAAHFAPELESAVRYCVFAHRLATLTDSGLARGEPSSDLIVSLGAFLEETGGTDPWMQAGTFMHELGHTLGLRHGGADVTNLKPNYLSVMNYSFQKQGLRVGGQDGNFDYSRLRLGDLDESSLNEGLGLGPEPLVAGYQTLYRIVGLDPLTFLPEVTATWSGDVTAPIDWDGSGTIDAGLVLADLNGNGTTEVLTGHDDWSALDLLGGTVGFGVGLPPPPPPPETEVVEELTVEEAKLIPPPPVEGLSGRAGRGRVRLSWTAVGPYGQGAYKVYRWSSSQPREAAVLVAETAASLIRDRAGRGTWNYAVTVTDALGAESLDSEILTVRIR